MFNTLFRINSYVKSGKKDTAGKQPVCEYEWGKNSFRGLIADWSV